MHFRIYTKPGCPFCTLAKNLVDVKGHTYSEENHDTPEKIMEFKAAGYKTFPQIFTGDRHIGGFDDLTVFYAGLETDDF